MFEFDLDETHEFVDAASVIAAQSPTGVLKFSPLVFSIMATALPPSPHCILALQIRPQFFRSYTCTVTLQYSWTFLDQFQSTIFEMKRNGFSELTFSSTQPDCAELIFNCPLPDVPSRPFKLSLCPANAGMDMGEFDYTIFVSIASKEFKTVVSAFKDYSWDYVLVTLTASFVHFSNGAREVIFTTQQKQCVIGGVSSRYQIQFQISLSPSASFFELARRSERVWLHKASRSSYGVIVAPIGLHSRFLAYVPQ